MSGDSIPSHVLAAQIERLERRVAALESMANPLPLQPRPTPPEPCMTTIDFASIRTEADLRDGEEVLRVTDLCWVERDGRTAVTLTYQASEALLEQEGDADLWLAKALRDLADLLESGGLYDRTTLQPSREAT